LEFLHHPHIFAGLIYYSGYIQTHCQKSKKIKRADQILPEVFGNTLNCVLGGIAASTNSIVFLFDLTGAQMYRCRKYIGETFKRQ
jgi:hypothetical protein